MSQRVRTGRRRAARWFDNAVTVLLVGGFLLCVAAVASGSFQIRPVLSGSMRPDLPVGGVVVTRRVPVSAVHVGDVIVFRAPDGSQGLVVHRIFSESPGPAGTVLQTKGDANTTPDPWLITLRGESAYRAVFAVPLVGYAAVWAHNPSGSRTLVLVGTVLVVVAGVAGLALWRREARRAAAAARRGTAVASTPPGGRPLTTGT